MSIDVKGVVKYSNDMYGLQLPTKNIHEEALVMWTLKRLQNRGPEEILLTYDEIRDISLFAPSTSKAKIEAFADQFLDSTSNMRADVKIAARLGSDDYVRLKVPLYKLAALSTEEQILKLSLNDEFLYLVNDVKKNFTALEYGDYFAKTTPSSKRLFTLLSRYKYLGMYTWHVADLRSILDCAESYSFTKFFNVHIKKSLDELEKDFPGLEVEKIKRGQKVIKLKFTWDAEAQKEMMDGEILDRKVDKLVKEAEKIDAGNKKAAKARETRDKIITKYISENTDRLNVPKDFDWKNTKLATPDEIRAKFDSVELLSFLKSRMEARGPVRSNPMARENFTDKQWADMMGSFIE